MNDKNYNEAFGLAKEFEKVGVVAFSDMSKGVKDGGIVRNRVKDNPLAGLGEILASRTYDESGNYVVQGMTVGVREHFNSGTNNGLYTTAQGGNRDGLAIGTAPGLAYVGGFKRTLGTTHYTIIRKPEGTETLEGVPVSTSFGNYLEIT